MRMIEQIIIDGGNARYLSELPEFKNGLPHGIVNKTKTDVGGTYVAANCSSNYIIVCPFRDLVDSISADKNNKYDVFKCYGGVREYQYQKYIKEHETHRKIAVTYDSLEKLLRWMNCNVEGWKVLVDEYQLIIEDMDYRESAIMKMCGAVQKFKHYTFLSSTPIEDKYEVDFFKELPHYKVTWNLNLQINIKKIKATNLPKGVCNIIQTFLDSGIELPDIDGRIQNVEQLFIFLNSVTTIKQIIDTLELGKDDVKICCASRKRNRLILGEYKIESAIAPNKRINFFTKKCFQGCNLFSNSGLIIVASDAHRTHTLVDISTTMEQISGRLRCNAEYQNIFRNTMVHIYSTNNNILTDEEFELKMQQKEKDAVQLLSLQEKATDEERETLIKRVNVETDLLSVENGYLVLNKLKRQAFIRKQNIRKTYKNGIWVHDAYKNKSEKFIQGKQELWRDFDIFLAKAVTISYEQLLKDYLDHPSEQYEQEYPEFKDFRRYLKESEMNSCRWNKEKMLKEVEDKKKLNKAFGAIYQRGLFLSNKDMKRILTEQFNRLGIDLSPKATQILNCELYDVTKCSQYENGKKINGYRMGDRKFQLMV